MKKVLISLLGLFCTLSSVAQEYDLPMKEGKFDASNESLQQYRCPDWFRDAKFGIWAHWGPQSVAEDGDWYARNMYISDLSKKIGARDKGTEEGPHRCYVSHCENFGHPSEFGYKELIELWKAEKWDPEELMKFYKKIGAKYFVSMGAHHDNYFLWDSQIHRWTSVKVGPNRDVVGEWQKAAKKEGLYFGVSEHLAQSYTWFQWSHMADKDGKYAGVPYDGANPEYQDLYHTLAAADDTGHLSINPEWHQRWYDCVKELIDMYDPDLLYSDSRIPFDEVGRTMMAHYYNSNVDENGEVTVVYNNKEHDTQSRFVRDVERGALEGINPEPWQTDTSIGSWFYKKDDPMRMSSSEVIKMLVDIVSKNGNLLLNVVQTPDGQIRPFLREILMEIGEWMEMNGEAIYGTRPWNVYGEGPSMHIEPEKGKYAGIKDVRTYLQGDLRFTKKGDDMLYVFNMMPIYDDVKIESIGKRKVESISILGSDEVVEWKQRTKAVTITKPKTRGLCETLVFAVKFKDEK